MVNHIVHEVVPEDLWPIWHVEDEASHGSRTMCDPCGNDWRSANIDKLYLTCRMFVRDSGFPETGTVWCDECGYVVNPDAELRANRRSGGW